MDPPASHRARALWRANAWLVPWLLVAIVVGVSIAGAQTGSAVPRGEPAGTPAEKAEAARVAVRCEVRHGFASRVAITAQMMARSFVSGTPHGDRVPGATCQVVQPP